MNQSIFKILYITLSLLILSACGVQNANEQLEKVKRIKTNVLLDRLDSLSLAKPEHFYAKLSTRYKSNSTKVSFKTSLRIRKDSAINAFITLAHIPLYTSMITPDTLTIVDRRNKCYIQEDMNFLKSSFGVDFEQHNLEELFLGLPVAWDINEKYFQIHDPYNYIISSHRKRQIKKADRKDTYDDVILLYYFDKEAKNIEKIIIEDPYDTAHIEIHYKKRQFINDYNVPELVDVYISTPKDTVEIEMEYNKTKVNQRKKLFLAIPEDYEICE